MSLPQLAAALLRQKLTVIAVIVAAFAAACAMTFSLPAEYDATATLAVGGARPLTQGANPVEFDQTLARTYGELLRTPSAAAEAARALPFEVGPGDLAGQVAFEAVGGTALLRITATDGDPRRAQLIANAYATSFVRVQQESLLTAARDGLERSNRRLRELALRISRLEQSDAPTSVADLEQARTELAAERDSYRARRQGIALQGSTLTVASPARLPRAPARPRPKLYLFFGALFAIVLGAVAGVLRDSFDTRVRNEDDLVQLLGAPVLARVPRAGRPAEPDELLEESFQLLRSNVELYDPGGRIHAIGVTGAARGQGSSLVAAGVARALALVGTRVAAVDCDLRQPTLHLRLHADGGGGGLSEALVVPSATTGLLQPTELPPLRLLPSGPPARNAAVLLTRESFTRVLHRLRDAEDYAICDLPPVTLGADAAAAAAAVDAAIVVVDSRSAQWSALVRVREQLENSGTRILGIVLNRVKGDRRPYGRLSRNADDAARPRELTPSR